MLRLLILALTAAPLAAQEFRARFVDAGGQPVAGVVVNQTPADARGRVAVPLPSLKQGRATIVTAAAEGFATLHWEFRPGDELDLGQVLVPRAARLKGRILDEDGELLGRDWRACAVVDGARRDWTYTARVDAGTGEFHLDDLPPGPITVWGYRGRHRGEPVELEFEAGQEEYVELRYHGRDPGEQLRLQILAPGATTPFPLAIEVRDARGKLTRVATRLEGPQGNEVLDVLGPTPWTVTVSGDAFEDVTTSTNGTSRQPLQIVLRGKASMRLRVIDGGTGEPVDGWRLRVKQRGMPVLRTPQASGTIVDGLYAGPVPFVLILPDGKLHTFDGPELEPGRVVEHEVRLPPRLDVTLVCSDERGAPLPGVAIRVEEEDDPVVTTAVTGEDGRVTLRGLFPGRHLAKIHWGLAFVEERLLEVTASGDLDLPAPPSGSLTVDVDLGGPPPVFTDLFLVVDGHRMRHSPRLEVGRLRAGEHRLELGFGVNDQGTWRHADVLLETIEIAPGQAARHSFDVSASLPAQLALSVRVDGALPGGFEFTMSPDPAWMLEGPSRAGSIERVCAPGTYQVGLVAKDGTWAFTFPEDLVLEPGERLEREVRIDRSTPVEREREALTPRR